MLGVICANLYVSTVVSSGPLVRVCVTLFLAVCGVTVGAYGLIGTGCVAALTALGFGMLLVSSANSGVSVVTVRGPSAPLMIKSLAVCGVTVGADSLVGTGCSAALTILGFGMLCVSSANSCMSSVTVRGPSAPLVVKSLAVCGVTVGADGLFGTGCVAALTILGFGMLFVSCANSCMSSVAVRYP